MTYPTVLPDTDLTLSPTATGLKESLVLHSATAQSSWVFPLTLKGLHPLLTAGGSVNLLNSADKVVLPEPLRPTMPIMAPGGPIPGPL